MPALAHAKETANLRAELGATAGELRESLASSSSEMAAGRSRIQGLERMLSQVKEEVQTCEARAQGAAARARLPRAARARRAHMPSALRALRAVRALASMRRECVRDCRLRAAAAPQVSRTPKRLLEERSQ